MRAALLATAMILVGTVVHAQPAPRTEAEAAFWEGRRLFDEGKTAEACGRFEVSQRLSPSVGTLFNLAICKEALGEEALAYRLFVEAEVRLPPDDPRRAIAAERAAALKARLGREVAAPPAPAPPPEPALTPPPGGPLASVASAAPPPRRSEAPPPERGPHRAIGWTAIGVGGASLVLGAIGGAVAMDAEATLEEDCGPTFDECTQVGLDAASRGETWAAISTVAFLTGALAVAAGTTVLVLSPTAPDAAGARIRWVGSF